MPEENETTSRRQAIRRILWGQRVGTQEELRALLVREGHDVTQATLSRDLARMGARRVSLSSGGSAYELVDAPIAHYQAELIRIRDLVIDVQDGETLVVVKTRAAAAGPVAAALDRARLPEILGTVAGDDTIFIAPRRGVTPARLAKHLGTLWKQGGSS